MTSETPSSMPANRTFAVVVNDDRFQLRVLQEHVRKSGLDAVPFHGAQEALGFMTRAAAAGDPMPVVVITDLYMPGLDGWRFCRLLRSPEFAVLNAIPILVVSATFAGDEPARIAADLGADGFLPVPVDAVHFQEQLRAVIEGTVMRSTLRALVVEDSRSIAAAIQHDLEAHGYEVQIVFTVGAALEAVSAGRFDVAIMDYHLPDGTGDTVLDRIHRTSLDTVCVMITTDTTPSLALDWMMRGATATVHKPFQPEYLAELCSRGRRERALLRVQDLLEERTKEVRRSLAEKETLLREVHHRVKNNLNVVSSLLSLQSSMIKDPDQAITAFQSARDRVAAMSLVHEELYKSLKFSRIDMKPYAETLVHNIARAHGLGGRVAVEVEVEPVELPVDTAVPCGLILNELVTNAFKYAFPGDREGRVDVVFTRCQAGSVQLTVKDNGVGFPSERSDGDSLGLTLVDLLARQISGQVVHTQDEGSRCTVEFPCEILQS